MVLLLLILTHLIHQDLVDIVMSETPSPFWIKPLERHFLRAGTRTVLADGSPSRGVEAIQPQGCRDHRFFHWNLVPVPVRSAAGRPGTSVAPDICNFLHASLPAHVPPSTFQTFSGRERFRSWTAVPWRISGVGLPQDHLSPSTGRSSR